MIKKEAMILALAFISLIGMVSAASPFQSSPSGTLSVEYSKIDDIQLNQGHVFHFHLFNDTSFLTNATAQCGFTLVQPNGSVQYKNPAIPYYQDSENEWEIILSGGNFSVTGEYSFAAECNTSSQVGFASNQIMVTLSGREAPTSGEGMIYLASIAVMFFFSLLFFGISFFAEGAFKFGALGVSLINSIIAIAYVNIALSEAFSGFGRISESYSIFLYVAMALLLIIFIFVLVSLTLEALDNWKTKHGKNPDRDP